MKNTQGFSTLQPEDNSETKCFGKKIFYFIARLLMKDLPSTFVVAASSLLLINNWQTP